MTGQFRQYHLIIFILTCSSNKNLQLSDCQKMFADKDKLYSAAHLPKRAVARDIHHPPHSLSSIISSHLLPHLVCGQPFVDEAHFGEVLHPRCHSGQYIHQLHYAQLALVFLGGGRKKRSRIKKRVRKRVECTEYSDPKKKPQKKKS